MELGVIMTVCGGAGTFIGFLITVATFTRNRDKDVRASATETATINAKLDNISGGVESLRVDFKVEQKERAALTERVTRVEESVSSAHKRIDEIGVK